MPGFVKVNPAQKFVISSKDFTSCLSPGEEIFINDQSYFVHDTQIMSCSIAPLSETCTDPGDSIAKLFVQSKYGNTPNDVNALDLSNTLENMDLIGKVNVRR